jgi:hypothetical protein
MGLLTPKGKKGDKKNNSNATKNTGQQSKFMVNKNTTKGAGGAKKGMMTGGAQRGS